MGKARDVIVVSGGSKGLGQGIVRHLLAQSYIVATFSRNKTVIIEELLQSCYRENFYWEAVDSSNYAGVSQWVKNVIKNYGKIDGLINNAGIVTENIITLMSANSISQMLDINLEGVIRLTQTCVKNMLLRSNGVIINITSVNGIRGHAGVAVYSASKAGLDGFMRSLARELGPRGIRVNSIAPGYLQTNMTSKVPEKRLQQLIRRTPLSRLGKVDDIVGVIDFLISPAAKFITGQTIVVDGGMTC